MAKHLDPESCVMPREVYGEALAGETSRPAIEPRNHQFGAPTLLHARRVHRRTTHPWQVGAVDQGGVVRQDQTPGQVVVVGEQIGGVPRRGIYDNMKTAVDKVNKGKGRTVNARFSVMCAHYLFDPDFCNVASGWEKGIVEKNVQDSRRRIWLDAQDCMFHTFEELNAWLGQRCRALWGELLHPQYNGLTVAEVLELERVEMMPMPTTFDGYVERTVRVSSTCLISVARNRYSVPCERVGQWVSSRLYPSRIVVIADETMIASHERLFDRDQVSFDWQHYIPLIERKPGALRNGAPFADLPKPLLLLKRGLRRHSNGDRIMTQVLAAVPIAGLDPVLVAVELVLESGSLSADHILNVLARLTATAPPPSVETSLQLKVAPVANTARYDQLRTTDEESRNA